jgi:hypothetical protein
VWVSWKHSDENLPTGKNVNVAVAAYVTTQARLKLYEYLSEYGESVLYCDTDSVIYVHKVDMTQKVTQAIIWVTSQMTWSNLAQAPISKSLSRVAQKTTHFLSFAPRTEKRTTKCKVKTFTMKIQRL